jgi:hypothetical protein
VELLFDQVGFSRPVMVKLLFGRVVAHSMSKAEEEQQIDKSSFYMK